MELTLVAKNPGVPDCSPALYRTDRKSWIMQDSRAGLKHLGTLHSTATYRRTTSFRIHEPIVLPGIFQTEAYVRRMLAYWYDFVDAPDDTDATVAMKAERTAIASTRPSASTSSSASKPCVPGTAALLSMPTSSAMYCR